MLPLRLEIKNFIAYRSPEPLVFDGIHLACLTGANGAGKSSLLDAITWALWGEARVSDDRLIHQGQSDMQVCLKFEQDGSIYEVIRKRSLKSRGVTSLELIAIGEDGTRNIHAEASVRQTQSTINNLLRLDYDTFIRSAFLKQGSADAFTRLKPAERKDTLAKILGLERYEAYEQSAKAQIAKYDQAIDLERTLLERCEAELRREPEIRATVEQARIAQQEAEAALIEADARLREVQSAPDALKAAIATRTLLSQRLKEHERDLTKVKADIARADQRVRDALTLVEQADDIAAGYQALQDAQAEEKILSEKLVTLKNANERVNTLEREIEKARAELDAQIRAAEAQIETLSAQAQGVDTAELDRLRADAATFDQTERQRDQLNEELKALENERAELTLLNRTLNDERDKLRTRLTKIKRIEGGTCPECGQPLTAEHQQQMIEEITAQGMQAKASMDANTARLETIGEAIKQKSGAFETATATIRQLRNARERAAALQAQAENATQARMQLEAINAELAAVRSVVEREDYAHALREELTIARRERDAIGYDDARYAAVRANLETYRGFDSRQILLANAQKELPDLQADLDNAIERQREIEEKQRQTEAEIAQNAADIQTFEARMQEYNTRKEEADRQRRREREASDHLSIVQQELRALDTQRELKAEYELKLATSREQRMIYEELRLAFGKKGIPTMIIETAIPELEATANDLLSRMTNGRMNLKLETQREKKSADGVIETLDIQIADELGTRPYESFSGGEAFRIDFALRVALSKMLSRRAGAPLQTLFVDEGFGTQDDDGREKLVEAITAIQDDFKLILVITHIEELRDSFEVQIQISKSGDGSRIVLR